MAARIPIDVTADSSDAQRDIKAVDKSIGNLDDTSKKASGSLGEAAQELTGMSLASLSGIGAIVGLVDALKQSITAAMEAESIQADLNATLASTQNAAGLTADEINAMAAEMSALTGIEDDSIVKAQAMLLTFTKIGAEVFPMATEAMLNMSVKFGGLESASVQLGKALNDPIEGVGALRRVGVALTDQQEASIKKFMAVNDVASAQKVILKELETEFGGLAEAAGNTTAGQMAKLKNSIGNISEAIGGTFLPALAAAAVALDKLLTADQRNVNALQGHKAEVIKTAQSYREYELELERAASVTGMQVDAQGRLYKTIWTMQGPLKVLVDETYRLSQAEFDAAQKTNELDGRLADLKIALMNEAGAFSDTGSAAVDYATKLDQNAKVATDRLSLLMQDLTTKTLYAQAAMVLSGPAAMKLAEAMGLINPVTSAAIGVLEDLQRQLEAGTIDGDQYAAAVAALGRNVESLKDKTVNVTVKTTYDGTPYGGSGSGGGGGGQVTDPNTGSKYGETPEEMAERLRKEAEERERERKARKQTNSGGNDPEKPQHDPNWTPTTQGLTRSGVVVNINGWNGNAFTLAQEIERQQAVKRLIE